VVERQVLRRLELGMETLLVVRKPRDCWRYVLLYVLLNLRIYCVRSCRGLVQNKREMV